MVVAVALQSTKSRLLAMQNSHRAKRFADEETRYSLTMAASHWVLTSNRWMDLLRKA